MEKTCGTCGHWGGKSGWLRSSIGGPCQRFPPYPFNQQGMTARTWTITGKDDWCGEWTVRPEGEGK